MLEGIRQLVEESGLGAEVTYARGCGIRGASKEGFEEAKAAAGRADVAVMVLGGSSARDFGQAFANNGAAITQQGSSEMDCGEGVDVANIELGGVQLELLKEVHATGTPIVVVLIQGRPHAIPWLKTHVHAIVCAWYPGEEGGRAIADILFGAANPNGRLSVSIPASSAQLPVSYNLKKSKHVHSYLDEPHQALYPFGFGLSYTTFGYSEFSVSEERISLARLFSGNTISLSVKVTNTGDRAGQEVVQLYGSERTSSVTARAQELVAFRKIQLEPGQSETVRFEAGIDVFSVWNAEMRFMPEPGRLRFAFRSGDETNEIGAVVHIEM